MVGDVAGVHHGDDGIERDPRAQDLIQHEGLDDGAGFAGRCLQQTVEERGLACAQESGENRRRYLVHRAAQLQLIVSKSTELKATLGLRAICWKRQILPKGLQKRTSPKSSAAMI